MQKQKRAILLLQSDTGKHEDFTRLRKAFLAIPGNENVEVVLMLNCLNSERTEPDYIFTLGPVRRRAVWKEYEILFIPTINVLGRNPIEITEEIKFLEDNGVKIRSAEEGEISAETLPLLESIDEGAEM